MSNISNSDSTYTSGGLDTRDALDGTSDATFQQMNGAASAPIAIQTILGDGPTLRGAAATLVARLANFLNATGKLLDFSTATKVTFPPTVSEGCTGATTLAANQLLLGSGTSPITVLGNGAVDQVLTSGTPPVWKTIGPEHIDAVLVLRRSSGDVTVSGTAETSLVSSFSVNANSLSTNRVIRTTLYFTDWNSNGGADATLRFKYGATTLVTITIAQPIGGRGIINFDLISEGSTTSQRGFVHLKFYDGTTFTQRIEVGTSTEDSTLAKDIGITYQNPPSGLGGLTARHATMERV